jgi:hypothetical protein
MPKPKVYLETSFIGYLTGRLSGDLITAAHQKLTRSWWDDQRQKFALHISDFVLREVSAGDPAAAKERLGVLAGVAELETPFEAQAVAHALIDKRLVPTKAGVDALHVAVAAVSGMDYLLTWNCKHIANATTREGIAAVIRQLGYKPVVLCTPEELMGVDDDNG